MVASPSRMHSTPAAQTCSVTYKASYTASDTTRQASAEHAATDPSNVFTTHMHIATNGGDEEVPETAGSAVT